MGKIIELESRTASRNLGWEVSTEDIVCLISGLAAFPAKGKGFLGIGSFHNLDIALDRQAQAIVLMDIDKSIVNLNREILGLIDQTDKFESLLPQARELIARQAVMELRDIDAFIGKGAYFAGSRTRSPLSWAKKHKDFLRLKHLLDQGKIAIVCADIT